MEEFINEGIKEVELLLIDESETFKNKVVSDFTSALNEVLIQENKKMYSAFSEQLKESIQHFKDVEQECIALQNIIEFESEGL